MFDFYKYLLLFMINLSLAITGCNEFLKLGIYTLDKAIDVNKKEYSNIRLEVVSIAKKLEDLDTVNAHFYSIVVTIDVHKEKINYTSCSEQLDSNGKSLIYLISEDLGNAFTLNISTSIITSYSKEDQNNLLFHYVAPSIGDHSLEAKETSGIKSLKFADISSNFTLSDNTTIDLDKWLPIQKTISQLVLYKLYYDFGKEKIGYGVLNKNLLLIVLLQDIEISRYDAQGELYVNQQKLNLLNFRDTRIRASDHKAQKILLINYPTVSPPTNNKKISNENLLLNILKIQEIINGTGKPKIDHFYFLVFGDLKNHFVGIKSFREENALGLLLNFSGSTTYLTLETDVNNGLIKLGMIVLICEDSKDIKQCSFLGEVTSLEIMNARLLIKVNYLTTNMLSKYIHNYSAYVALDLDSSSKMTSYQDHSDTPPSPKRLKIEKTSSLNKN